MKGFMPTGLPAGVCAHPCAQYRNEQRLPSLSRTLPLGARACEHEVCSDILSAMKKYFVFAAVVLLGGVILIGYAMRQRSAEPSVVAPTATTTQIGLEPESAARTYTLGEVRMHDGVASCWAAVNGKVYDLTSFVSKHPGGDQNILNICGKDGTAAFANQHEGDQKPNELLASFYLGDLK